MCISVLLWVQFDWKVKMLALLSIYSIILRIMEKQTTIHTLQQTTKMQIAHKKLCQCTLETFTQLKTVWHYHINKLTKSIFFNYYYFFLYILKQKRAD